MPSSLPGARGFSGQPSRGFQPPLLPPVLLPPLHLVLSTSPAARNPFWSLLPSLKGVLHLFLQLSVSQDLKSFLAVLNAGFVWRLLVGFLSGLAEAVEGPGRGYTGLPDPLSPSHIGPEDTGKGSGSK